MVLNKYLKNATFAEAFKAGALSRKWLWSYRSAACCWAASHMSPSSVFSGIFSFEMTCQLLLGQLSPSSVFSGIFSFLMTCQLLLGQMSPSSIFSGILTKLILLLSYEKRFFFSWYFILVILHNLPTFSSRNSLPAKPLTLMLQTCPIEVWPRCIWCSFLRAWVLPH